jgi:lysophospholipase L1-like esterase
MTATLESMNRTIKLLAIALAVLIAISVAEAYVIFSDSSSNGGTPIRVACVGDSLTRGTEYTLFLWEQLGSGYILSDFGVGGTTASMNSEKPYRNESAFLLAQSFQPDVVIIMLGTNDAGLNVSSESFTRDYTVLVETFKALQTTPVMFIVQPPPIVNSTALSNAKLAGTIIPAIQAIAEQTGATLVDAYTPMLNHMDNYTDGVHPDADGAKVIADAIYAGLAQAGYS